MTEPKEPAYPSETERQTGPNSFHFMGLTKREYFAAMAMQGMLAGSQGLDIKTWEFSEQSIALADSLITELNK